VVEEGQVVFDNIWKVTLFLSPTGFAAILSILIALILVVAVEIDKAIRTRRKAATGG
jgi:hypothetical protein